MLFSAVSHIELMILIFISDLLKTVGIILFCRMNEYCRSFYNKIHNQVATLFFVKIKYLLYQNRAPAIERYPAL